ncbi:MAG: hypothetical protein ACTSWL_03320 [Promethearchaeota archaeon]
MQSKNTHKRLNMGNNGDVPTDLNLSIHKKNNQIKENRVGNTKKIFRANLIHFEMI